MEETFTVKVRRRIRLYFAFSAWTEEEEEEGEEHAFSPSVSPYLISIWQQRAAADVGT